VLRCALSRIEESHPKDGSRPLSLPGGRHFVLICVLTKKRFQPRVRWPSPLFLLQFVTSKLGTRCVSGRYIQQRSGKLEIEKIIRDRRGNGGNRATGGNRPRLRPGSEDALPSLYRSDRKPIMTKLTRRSAIISQGAKTAQIFCDCAQPLLVQKAVAESSKALRLLAYSMCHLHLALSQRNCPI